MFPAPALPGNAANAPDSLAAVHGAASCAATRKLTSIVISGVLPAAPTAAATTCRRGRGARRLGCSGGRTAADGDVPPAPGALGSPLSPGGYSHDVISELVAARGS